MTKPSRGLAALAALLLPATAWAHGAAPAATGFPETLERGVVSVALRLDWAAHRPAMSEPAPVLMTMATAPRRRH